MNEHKFTKGIEEIKKIGLTDAERSLIFSKIIDKTKSALINPMPAPRSKFSWVQKLFIGYRFQPVMAFALIFILAGGGLVFGSTTALPGNPLYPFKVGVIEPLVGSLLTREDKANYQVTLATNRLFEAETLAAEGKLDEPKQLQIENLIAEHTLALKDNLAVIDSEDIQLNSGSSENQVSLQSAESAPTIMSASQVNLKTAKKNNRTDAIRLDFEARMNTHAKLLEDISNEKMGTTSNEVLNVANRARESGRDVGNDKGDDSNKNNEEQNKKGDKKIKVINLKQPSVSDNQQVLPAAVGASVGQNVQVENQADTKAEVSNQKQSTGETDVFPKDGEASDENRE